MKIKTLLFIVLSLLAALGADAQGTAFTYQGQLTQAGEPVSGTNFGMTFSLYDAPTNGNLIGSVYVNPVVVSNGLFTVPLDFGNVFDGNPRWLMITVQQDYARGVPLLPLQQVTPTPYAVMAASASNLLGSVSAAQLPTSLITNGETGVDVSGTFTGNGSGLTNVPASWQTISGTSQIASANQSYLLTNNAQTTLTLPSTANVGDIVTVSGVGSGGWQVLAATNQTIVGDFAPGGVIWMQQTNAPSEEWQSIASSSDGSHLEAVAFGGGIYASTNFGANWTQQTNAPTGDWLRIASSSDASHLAAVLSGVGIYTSTNFGANWTPQTNAASADWNSVTSSSDGSHLATTTSDNTLYTSTNFGVTWTIQNNAPPAFWFDVVSSSDGSHLAAVGYSGVYTSTNFGATWISQLDPPATLYCIASSSDGSHLAVGEIEGGIYTSSDFGANWTEQTNGLATGAFWISIVSSSDGSHLSTVASGGGIYTSINFGATWMDDTSAPLVTWDSIASSTDGSHLAAVESDGKIYTSTQQWLPFTGASGSTAEFQYIGNGNWQPLGIPPALLTPSLVGNGGGLTNLNAAALTGTIPNAVLPPDVALLDNDNTFTGAQVFDGTVNLDTPLNLEGDFMINTNTYINAHVIYFRGGDEGVADHNHGLGYEGPGFTNFGGTNLQYVDGPALWGNAGGVLGTRSGGDHGALVWDTASVTVNGTFNNNSDRNAKENFSAVAPSQILEKVTQLPLSQWSYKQDATTRHIGPMAQDFYAAFNVGTDDKHIAPIDEGGVALAAIKGLNQKMENELKEKDRQIQDLERRLNQIETTIDQMRRR